MDTTTERLSIGRAWYLKPEIVMSLLAFVIPIVISGPQWLTGTLVNTLLFVASVKLAQYKIVWFISILPSLGAVSQGVLFGSFTPFLIYFLPFIWLGNVVLIKSHQLLLNKSRFPVTFILPSVFKMLVLFSTAFIFVSFGIIPKIFLTSMGLVQLLTALTGGIIAHGICSDFSLNRNN